MIYPFPGNGLVGALASHWPAAERGERGPCRFDFLIDPAGTAITLMKAVSS